MPPFSSRPLLGAGSFPSKVGCHGRRRPAAALRGRVHAPGRGRRRAGAPRVPGANGPAPILIVFFLVFGKKFVNATNV